MKNTVVFAGFMGALLAGNVALAFPSDTSTYPEYQVGTQSIDGTNYVTKDAGIKLATTKYVDAKVDGVNTEVQTLARNANTDNSTVTANAGNISNMQTDRLVVPNNPCGNLGNEYSGCGYVAPDGDTSGTDSTKYQWYKIIATTDSVVALNTSNN